MLTCLSCSQPIAPSAEPSYRFARIYFNTTDDDHGTWGEETAALLEYLDALFSIMRGAKQVSAEAVDTLQQLGWDITKEAQLRLHKLQAAAEIWEERAKASTSTAAQPSGEQAEG